ncbi:hypothetical protein [Limosilactobacillus fermentum]|uniref:hypothetical protein n=1 Tax=Limosilactobacillus fermentum TaxID=1613 RepID=UPI002455A22C|nr:hypothetical protein [Limosilactobacillus fermentum]MDH5017395.1 hypothetical protein [Limosilactobacillus fermentum]
MERTRTTIRMAEWINKKMIEIAQSKGDSVNSIIVNACIKYADYFEKNYGPMIKEAKKNE